MQTDQLKELEEWLLVQKEKNVPVTKVWGNVQFIESNYEDRSVTYERVLANIAELRKNEV